MRKGLAVSLGLGLALCVAVAHADDFLPGAGSDQPSAAPPTVSLGRPMPLPAGTGEQAEPTAPAVSERSAENGSPPGVSIRLVRAQSPDYSGPTLAVPTPLGSAPPASPAEQYNCGVVNQEPEPSQPFLEGGRRLWSGITGLGKEFFDSGEEHHLFESDHAFDGFISPVTNPFFFEDPRALTEVRPIFFIQGAPSHNPVFHGGDIEYFGVQGRLAITECLSLVISKLGFVAMEPHTGTSDFQDHFGFAEINLGPKYTFLRSESTGTLGAGGLNFVIPAGDRRVLQDTGSLTLEPYVSFGQSFLRTSYGTFQALTTFGYNFSVDRQRSDNFFSSWHLDYDYGNFHKIYPLIELNWFHYTRNGKSHDLDFEGADLFNFGSRHVAGHNDLTMALGARYKYSECIQFGGAFEFLLTGRRDLEDFRLMLDVIFRY